VQEKSNQIRQVAQVWWQGFAADRNSADCFVMTITFAYAAVDYHNVRSNIGIKKQNTISTTFCGHNID
jgi:hypothetical protein